MSQQIHQITQKEFRWQKDPISNSLASEFNIIVSLTRDSKWQHRQLNLIPIIETWKNIFAKKIHRILDENSTAATKKKTSQTI